MSVCSLCLKEVQEGEEVIRHEDVYGDLRVWRLSHKACLDGLNEDLEELAQIQSEWTEKYGDEQIGE
jgi:hypothetical protein